MSKLGEGHKGLQYEALRQFIKTAGLKYIEFADLAGINRSSFQTMLSKQSSIKSDTFMKIINAMNHIISNTKEGSDMSQKLSILSLIFMIPDEDLPEVIKKSGQARDIDTMLLEDIEIIQLLTGATLVDGNLIYPDGTRVFSLPKIKGASRGLKLKNKIAPIQSDKAVRVVCNMDTWIYNQVAKSAEENNRTFEDELEDILYWTFENEENQTGDGYTGL